MRVGYARVSASDQNITAQVLRLPACDRVFSEKLSGRTMDRPALRECLAFVREGDTLYVTRLDRLARSLADLCDIAAQLERRRVALVVVDQAIDTTTPTGMLLFHVLGALAQFEVSIRREQQQAGIAYAREHGVHLGRRPSLTVEDLADIRAAMAGGTTLDRLAARYRCSERTIKNHLRAGGELAARRAPDASDSSTGEGSH